MINFKLNISKMSSNISKYNAIKNNHILDINSIYNSLKNIESGWNDSNTSAFLSAIKKDKYELDNYFNKINKTYKKIEQFKNEIETLLLKYGKKKDSTIVYDDSYYQVCLKNINNILTCLKNTLYYINSCHYDQNFQLMARIYSLKNEIALLNARINDISTGITLFKKNIENIVSNTQVEINKIEELNLNIKNMTYKWNTVDSQISNSINQIEDNN